MLCECKYFFLIISEKPSGLLYLNTDMLLCYTTDSID